MNKPQKNIAVILGAGKGTRSGFIKPKQLMKLAGKPVIEHSIQAFQNNEKIDEIIIVTNQDCIDAIEQIILSARLSKVKNIINGGEERSESSLSAIKATKHYCEKYDVKLIFHDAVRPLISQETINNVIDALSSYNAIDVVTKTTDTIIAADPITNTILNIPSRSQLRNGQTPQAFSHKIIEEAYELACRDPNFTTTDDCGVILKYLPDEKIYLVNGTNDNIKLTYEEDLHILDKLCQLRSNSINSKENQNFTLKPLKGKNIIIFGGTSGIGQKIDEIATAYQAKVISTGTRHGIDITNHSQVESFLSACQKELGHIDYVINTAAILTKQPLIDMSAAEVRRSIEVNYIGAVNVAIASFEILKNSQGQLLNFTSSSYTYGRAFYSIYSSCKAAVVNLTQALADEWHSHGVRVNCINPERTDTPMRTKAFGIEPKETLLDATIVAERSLMALLSNHTGQVFDIKK